MTFLLFISLSFLSFFQDEILTKAIPFMRELVLSCSSSFPSPFSVFEEKENSSFLSYSLTFFFLFLSFSLPSLFSNSFPFKFLTFCADKKLKQAFERTNRSVVIIICVIVLEPFFFFFFFFFCSEYLLFQKIVQSFCFFSEPFSMCLYFLSNEKKIIGCNNYFFD